MISQSFWKWWGKRAQVTPPGLTSSLAELQMSGVSVHPPQLSCQGNQHQQDYIHSTYIYHTVLNSVGDPRWFDFDWDPVRAVPTFHLNRKQLLYFSLLFGSGSGPHLNRTGSHFFFSCSDPDPNLLIFYAFFGSHIKWEFTHKAFCHKVLKWIMVSAFV